MSSRTIAGLSLILALLAGGCGAAQTDSNGAIRAAIADAPQCPAPPAAFTHNGARRWLTECKQVAVVAAENVARGLAEAERRRDLIWTSCLRSKHDAIEGFSMRIAAERIALGGMGRERAVARVRRHCQRVQLLVAEAQNCV